jgi:hypothetical protein
MLTMADLFLVVFAPLELHDFNLIGSAVRLDGRGDLATIQEGCTNVDIVAVRDHQNLVELDRRPFLGFQFFDAAKIAFGDPVLFTTCADYSIHGVFSKSLTEKARILAGMPVYGKHLRHVPPSFHIACLTGVACGD